MFFKRANAPEEQHFKMIYKPLKSWLYNVLSDGNVAPEVKWYAEKLYRLREGTWMRFRGQPWTANEFWSLCVSFKLNLPAQPQILYPRMNYLPMSMMFQAFLLLFSYTRTNLNSLASEL